MQNGSKLKEAVHFFLNGRGGVGKTHTATYLTQGYRAAGLPVVALDADATSATFSSFKGLGVRRVNVMEGDKINERIFDNIVEEILTQDTNFVIDTGASAFVELSRYFNRNEIPDHIARAGKRFVANVIITGGVTFNETSLNLKSIAEQMPPSVEIVVWLNQHFGPIGTGALGFENLEIYKMTGAPDQNRRQARGSHLYRGCDLRCGRQADDVQGLDLWGGASVAGFYVDGQAPAASFGAGSKRKG